MKNFGYIENLSKQSCFSLGLPSLCRYYNMFPHSKSYNLSRFNTSADYKFEVYKNEMNFFDTIENIVGKVEKAGY